MCARHLSARDELALDDLASMDEEPGHRRLHVVDVDDCPLAIHQPAVITQLATGLGVEGGAVEHDLDVLADTRRGHGLAVPDDADHPRRAHCLRVAREGGGAARLEDVAVRGGGGEAALAGP
jgi:hypothetical protein